MGRKVAIELEGWKAIQDVAVRDKRVGAGALETFVDDGEWLYSNLRALVHGESVPSGFSNRKVSRWLAYSRRSRSTIGRRLLHVAEPEGD